VKRFRDREPIADPRAKKLATCANEDKRHPSAESPTSENAATERHAQAEREDPPTKDLTRGIEDVNDRNVRCTKDPRTSLEASAEGTSAERAEGPMAPCAATLHETQDRPQNSLQATLRRLPIEDEPSECEQEAAESLVTAERTNGTAQSANPRETIADVDETAALGREPAEVASGIGEGDETERERQSRLQQTHFYCKEDRQRNENANADVPAHTNCRSRGSGQYMRAARRETREAAPMRQMQRLSACIVQASREGPRMPEDLSRRAARGIRARE